MRISLLLVLAILLGLVVGVSVASLRLSWVPWQGYLLGGPGDPHAGKAASATAFPRVVVPETEYRFGTMDIAAEGSHRFEFKNQGVADLELTAGPTSCGCAGVDVPERPVPAGQSALVAVHWKSKNIAGPYHQTATIYTNDPGYPRVTLTISGQMTAAVEVIPPELSLGQISAGETASGEVRIYAFRSKRLAISGQKFLEPATAGKFAASSAPLTAEQLRQEAGAQSGVAVQIKVKSGLPLGAIRQTISLQTNLSERPAVEVPIQGMVAGDISVFGPGWDNVRQVLDMGTVGEEGSQRSLILIARGAHCKDVNFKLQRVTPPWLEVHWQPPAISGTAVMRRELTIRIPPGTRPANFLGPTREAMGCVTVATGHPEIPTLRIYVAFARL